MQMRNPDSWEGWYWGTKHFWGGEPFGLMPNPTNIYPDVSWNSDLLLFWGCDPTTTTRGFSSGDYVSRFCFFWKDIGIKQIYICPDLNYGAAVFADKWIPILPNTDAAMQLAIAYQWIINDTYDKEYLATHSVGFDKFKDYVLGKEDGSSQNAEVGFRKRPEFPPGLSKPWRKNGLSKRTTVVHGLGGPYIRGPYSHEPARLEGALLAMQGLGKPGSTFFRYQLIELFLVQKTIQPFRLHPAASSIIPVLTSGRLTAVILPSPLLSCLNRSFPRLWSMMLS